MAAVSGSQPSSCYTLVDMPKASAFLSALLLTCAGSLSCTPAHTPPTTPAPSEPEPAASPAPSATDDAAPARAEVTAKECEASGGTVVGDIGDGAIHRADYHCPSGAKPSGNIAAEQGGPVAVEGSVCCPK